MANLCVGWRSFAVIPLPCRKARGGRGEQGSFAVDGRTLRRAAEPCGGAWAGEGSGGLCESFFRRISRRARLEPRGQEPVLVSALRRSRRSFLSRFLVTVRAGR